MSDDIRRELVFTILRLGLVATASYFTVKWMMSAIDPTRKQKNKAKERVSLFLFYFLLLF